MKNNPTVTENRLFRQSLMMNPHVRIIHCSDSEIMVKHGSRSRFSQIIRDEGHTKLLGKILRNLKEPSSLEAIWEKGYLADHELEDAVRLVEYLLNEEVLIEPDSYLPHVYLSMRFGKGVQKIAARTVGMVGSGFVGSRIARELSRLKVREIVILDDRRIQPTDVTYLDLNVEGYDPGEKFGEVVTRDLSARNESTVRWMDRPMDDPQALGELFEQADFVVVALESYSPRVFHTVNEVAVVTGKPWMSAFFDGSEAIIGPIYVPGETPCYNEFEIQQEAVIGLKEDYIVYKEELLEADLDCAHLVLPPYLSLMSGWLMTALIPFLISGRSFAVGRSLRVDLERLSVDGVDVLKLPRCPACSAQRPGYRHLFL